MWVTCFAAVLAFGMADSGAPAADDRGASEADAGYAMAVGDDKPRERLVYRAQHCPATDLASAVSALLQKEQAAGADVAIVPEAVSNALLLSGPREQIGAVRAILEQLDQPPAMIRVKVLLVEVASAEQSGSTRRIASRLTQPDGTLTAEALETELQQLKKEERLRSLDRVEMVTIDNQAAFLQIGQRVSQTAASRAGRDESRSGKLENIGLIVGLTPRVGAGQVTMELDVERATIGPVSASSDSARLPIDVSTVQSTIALADGQMIVLAGACRSAGQEQTELWIVVTAAID